jgi:hypothetical protein
MKGVAIDSNSRMIKIINRLADSGFARVGFREVTPCELWNKVVDNRIVEVYGLECNFDNREMLMDFLRKGRSSNND